VLGRGILKQLFSSLNIGRNCWCALLAVAGLVGLVGCGGLAGKQQDQGPGLLTPSPTSLTFGNVPTGTSQSLNDTVTNTGQSTLTISQIAVTGTGYSITGISAPLTLAAGDSASFSVQFAPTATGAVSGNVALTTDSGTVNLPLSGTGVQGGDLTATPTSISFGNVVDGSAASQTVTLKNTGSENVTITAAAVSGAGFSDSGLTLPLTLTPNQTSTFSVGFAPTLTGAVVGNVALTVTGEPELDVPLSGQGIAPATLTANPTSLTFTNVQVGANSTQSETIKNTGGASAQITAVTATGTGFSVSGITLPVTVGAGQSVSFNVTFAPQSAGSFSGNVAVTSNAQNPNLSIPVTGTALAAATLTANPTSLTFTNVLVGANSTQSETIKNTGGASAQITGVAATGTGFSVSGITLPVTVGAGQSVSFNVTFAPQSAGTFNGNVAVTSNAQNPNLNIPVTGTALAAATLTANPTSLTFTNVLVGANSTQSETIKNTGGTSAQITAVAASGTGFSVSGITLPVTLTAGQSVSFNVTFAPQSAGTFNGNVAVTSNAQNPNLSIPVTATAVAAATLTANPTSLTFTNVQVGTNSTQSETIKNTGGTSAQITAVAASGTGFSVSGITLPLTLTAGQSVSFNVTFAPQSAGNASGTVTVTSNAQNPTLTIPVSGTAVAGGDLTASPTSIAFGNVILGDATSQIVTLKNTGGENVTVTAASISGAGFSFSGLTVPMTFTPNQSTTFSVTFDPTSAGAVSGTMSLTVSGSANIGIPLTGTGVTQGNLTANPTSITFTGVQVGQNSSQTETVKNTGGSVAHITQVAASGTGFSFSGITPPVTLNAGQSVSFSVTFAPQSAGTFSGSVTVTSDAQNPTLTVPVSGTAVAGQGTLSVSSPINVGNVVDGTSGTATGTLTASGANVSVSSVSLSGANSSEFSITGLSYPVTVTVGSPVSFTVNFSPTATGSASASASFASNASNSPTSASLTGNGTPAPVHTVQLTWVASPTTGITSYNVYRAVFVSACGTYSSIGSTTPSNTAFTDNNVTDGTTYCYATTAVDPSGESAYSNIAQAQIPPP
jgi:hypothetical protein